MIRTEEERQEAVRLLGKLELFMKNDPNCLPLFTNNATIKEMKEGDPSRKYSLTTIGFVILMNLNLMIGLPEWEMVKYFTYNDLKMFYELINQYLSPCRNVL